MHAQKKTLNLDLASNVEDPDYLGPIECSTFLELDTPIDVEWTTSMSGKANAILLPYVFN